ncbi:MAG: patatin-like phospholipase family protein [Betaproteobacteria bacterium]|nr:patatin-like phospholipase family protein [Betaproteobacteria bacterium]
MSDAVMASAAFPGVFNSIQVAQYIDGYGKYSSKPGSYLHLIDGGASDNLGIDALITAAAGHEFSVNRAESKNKNRCLLIVVDSHIGNSIPLNNKLYDGRTGFSDHFIDSNYGDAFDALLLRRREEQLRDLGIEIGYEKKSSRKVRFFPDSKINLRNFSFQRIGNTSYLAPDSNDNVTEMDCAIWHVALDNAVTDTQVPIKIP